MSDKPIIFSTPMVRALLDGRKTQTRRILKMPIKDGSLCVEKGKPYRQEEDGVYRPVKPPYAVGDRLWVREAWRADVDVDEIPPRDLGRKDAIRYEADQAWKNRPPVNGRLRPARFMCRWMSRFTLTVVARKTERLHHRLEWFHLSDEIKAFIAAGEEA